MKTYIKICKECNRKFRCIGTCLDVDKRERECYCPECNWETEDENEWRERDDSYPEAERCYSGIIDPYNLNPWKQDINTGKKIQ